MRPDQAEGLRRLLDRSGLRVVSINAGAGGSGTTAAMVNLAGALAERGSEFRAIFDALAGFAGEPEALEQIRQQAATEGEDETVVYMDQIWEDEAVSFMGAGDACKSQTAAVSPITITPRDQFVKAQNRSH